MGDNARQLISDVILSSAHSSDNGTANPAYMQRAIDAGIPEITLRNLVTEVQKKIHVDGYKIEQVESDMKKLRDVAEEEQQLKRSRLPKTTTTTNTRPHFDH